LGGRTDRQYWADGRTDNNGRTDGQTMNGRTDGQTTIIINLGVSVTYKHFEQFHLTDFE